MRGRLFALSVVIAVGLIMTRVIDSPIEAQGSLPTISNVSGSNLTHGGTLSISGVRFGTRASAAPLKYDDFQSVALGSEIVSSSAPGPAWTNNAGYQGNQFNPIATTQRLRPGTPFTRNMTSHWQQPAHDSASNIALVNQNFRKVYFDAWMYNDTSGASGIDGGENVKHIRLHQAGTGAPNLGFTDTGPRGGQFFSIAGDGKFNDFTMYYSNPVMDPATIYNAWVHMQWAVDSGSGGTATNGKVRVYVNGALRSTSDSASLLNAGYTSWPELYIGNYWRTQDWTGTIYAYWESMYVDRAWARVEVGNNSVYANCTQRETQIPTAWSDGAITVTINRGSFATLSPLYLFVVDEGGVPSAGFPLNGVSPAPGKPTNLRIVPGA